MKIDEIIEKIKNCATVNQWVELREELYQLSKQLKEEMGNLHKAAKIGHHEMNIWLAECECDCPPEGHTCGVDRLKSSIEFVDNVLKGGGV